MPTGFLTEEQYQLLRLAHKAQREKRLADRIKAILMFHSGFTYFQITQALLMDETTIRRYLAQYQHKGIDGLLEMRYTGGSTRLTLIQEQDLKVFLTTNTKRTAKEIADYVVKTYSIKYPVIGITKLLHRLGFTYKKPKVIPGKADPAKQQQFLSVYQGIKENLAIKDQIYFADSTHPEHNTKPSYGWILKGKVNDKYIKTNTGRERLNLTGAIRLTDTQTTVFEQQTVNSLSTLRLMKKLEKKQPQGKIYLILDNASYHHSGIVKNYTKRKRRIKLIFLPPYSPNLNPIERLWRLMHQRLTWNRYFATYHDFRQQTLRFFSNIQNYRTELDTLITDNFQLLPVQQLQTWVCWV